MALGRQSAIDANDVRVKAIAAAPYSGLIPSSRQRARDAVRGVLTVSRRLGQNLRTKRRDAESTLRTS